MMHELERVPTDAALDEIERNYKALSTHTLTWIAENMGMGAAGKYGGGMPAPTQFTWAGEHSSEHRQKRLGMMQRMMLKIQNIDDLLASDRWDDPTPLQKRKRTKEWKLLRDEANRIRSGG